MKNYVLMSSISDEPSEKKLQKELQKSYPRNDTVIENGMRYFYFAGRDLQDIQGRINKFMDDLTLIEDDYIALYYTEEEDPDNINRLMMFGTSNVIEDDLKNISNTTLQNILTDLMEADLLKEKS